MSARLKALLLVLPLIAFLGLFFLWPLWMMIATSVQGGTVRLAFPHTASAIAKWDGVGAPPPAVQAALVQDLRAEIPQERFGDSVRTLNSQQAGFRTLLPRTARAVREAGETDTIDLAAIDLRWNDPAYWLALKRGSFLRINDLEALAANGLNYTRAREGEWPLSQ